MQPDTTAGAESMDQSHLLEDDDTASTYLTFDLDTQSFAVQVEHVREILDAGPITRLPDAPHEVLGVIDVRGKSVPIYDLSGRLGAVSSLGGDDIRVIVFEVQGEAGGSKPVGILSDKVRDVCRIEFDAIESKPDLGGHGADSDLVIGLCRLDAGLVVVVDLARLFGNRTIPF